jgi:thioredoxin 1
MLRRLFGKKPKPPTIPLEYRNPTPTITDGETSASTLSGADGVQSNFAPAANPGTVQGAVRELVDADFERVIVQSDRLSVVDFWAEWCPPCEIISLYASWLARDYGAQLLVASLDVDENPITPERFSIMGLPTLIFFRGGVEVDRQVGLLSHEELQAKTEALLASGQ